MHDDAIMIRYTQKCALLERWWWYWTTTKQMQEWVRERESAVCEQTCTSFTFFINSIFKHTYTLFEIESLLIVARRRFFSLSHFIVSSSTFLSSSQQNNWRFATNSSKHAKFQWIESNLCSFLSFSRAIKSFTFINLMNSTKAAAT